MMITEGLLQYLPGATIEALAADAVTMSGVRFWLADLASAQFATAIGMDSFQQVQSMRAAGHLNGDQLFEAIKRNGWTTVARCSYLTDVWSFGAERLQAAARNRPASGSMPAFPPDDPSGVHLLGRA